MVRALGLTDVAIGRDIVDSGNTSSASIPLALTRMLQTGEAKSGDLALVLGFGAGLTYAGQVLVCPWFLCPLPHRDRRPPGLPTHRKDPPE